MKKSPLNHRRTTLYRLLKRIVWTFWKPYYLWRAPMEQKFFVRSKKTRYIITPINWTEDYFQFEEVAHEWAFCNLSILGKELKK